MAGGFSLRPSSLSPFSTVSFREALFSSLRFSYAFYTKRFSSSSTATLQFCKSCFFCSSTLNATQLENLKRMRMRSHALCCKMKKPRVHTNSTARIGAHVQPYDNKKRRRLSVKFCASSEDNRTFGIDDRPMRKVVEHVVLFQMQEGFTENQEEDMLDHLYTLQYQFRGILAISLGRLATPNSGCCTHGLFMRFPSKKLLLQYMDHPARLKVAEEFIVPYYKGLIVADFESFVKSDIGPLFRRGEDYASGIEYILLFEAKKDISAATIEGVINALTHLQHELGQLVVQLTAGRNFSPRNQGYTHGLVARIPSGWLKFVQGVQTLSTKAKINWHEITHTLPVPLLLFTYLRRMR